MHDCGRSSLGLLLCLVVGGCSGLPSRGAIATDGPLTAGSGEAHYCLPVAQGASITFGHDVFRSSGDEQLSVLDVELEDADGVTVQQAVFVPLLTTDYIGTYDRFPPPMADLRRSGLAESWARRQAVGRKPIVLDTAFPHELVLELKATAPRATATGITVTYEAGDDRFTVTTDTALELVSEAPCA